MQAFLYPELFLSHSVEAFKAIEMLAPIAIVQIGNLDAVSAGVDKAIVADENADVRDAWAECVLEEHEIARLRRADSK